MGIIYLCLSFGVRLVLPTPKSLSKESRVKFSGAGQTARNIHPDRWEVRASEAPYKLVGVGEPCGESEVSGEGVGPVET
jgi:hypothetical protein